MVTADQLHVSELLTKFIIQPDDGQYTAPKQGQRLPSSAVYIFYIYNIV